MKTVKLLGALASAACLFAATQAAAVTVVGATRIEVRTLTGDFMQIAEIEAIEAGTLDNVAASANGGAGVSSSNGFGTTAGLAIDGNDDSAFGGGSVWHSGPGDANAFYFLTLGRTATLASLRMVGRSDVITFRDIYDVKIFNAANNVLYAGVLDARGATHEATVTFDLPPPGAIPEPSTWAMMILGFGAAGAAIRSRRRAVLA